MRRRPQRLQVSTFPFLAVLLCAMGALILLLLVLDRRARVVAVARLREQVSQAQAEEERAAAEHRAEEERAAAELERRRRALHALLLQQDEEVQDQVRSVHTQTESTAAAIGAGTSRSRELQDQVRAVQARLAHGEQELASRRAEVAKVAQQSEASKAELARLTASLEELERTLKDLKAARQRQQQTYSLVPYKGKRGDNRRPLYVECTSDGLTFHPDRAALNGLSMSGLAIRKEIEQRITRQRSDVVAAGGKPDANAYLLMLVRPDGIRTYYQTMAALQGLPVDFGYEFIDRDWVLDFPEGDAAPALQPWMVAKASEPIRPAPAAPRRSPRPVGLRGLVPDGQYRPAPEGETSAEGSPTGLLGQPRMPAPAGLGGGTARGITSTSGAAPGASPGGSPGGGEWTVPTAGGVPQGLAGARAQGTSPVRGATPSGIYAGGGGTLGTFGGGGLRPGPGFAAIDSAGRATQRASGDRPADGSFAPGGPPASASPRYGPGGGDGRQVAGVGGGQGPTGQNSGGMPAGVSSGTVSGGSGGPPAATGTGFSGSGAVSATNPPAGVSGEGMPTSPAETGAATATGPSGAPSAGVGGGLPSVSAQGTATAGSSTPPGQPSSGLVPAVVSGSAGAATTAAASGAGEGMTGAASGHGGTGPVGEPGPEGGSSDGSGVGGTPTLPLLPPAVRKKPSAGALPRALVWNRNRDWVLGIECTADALIVQPTGPRIATAALATAIPGNNPLLLAVRQSIARRQATLPPDEPPYRVQIRFRVHPDGLRSYYVAYPALESLGVPMTRENLEPDDDLRPNGIGR